MHDGEGTIVTVECKNGDTYRGFLDETELARPAPAAQVLRTS